LSCRLPETLIRYTGKTGIFSTTPSPGSGQRIFRTMSCISLHGITIAFGGHPVLDEVSLDIHKGQRICIVGRNGAGKSTLMKIIGGDLAADAGDVIRAPGVACSYLQQDIESSIDGKVCEIVAAGAGKTGELWARLHRLITGKGDAAEITRLEHQLAEHNGWHIETVVKRVLEQVQQNGDAEFSLLSGGMRRRVLLARALAREPDLLLLDEPTNHCDISTITWLESFILSSRLTVLFVTHDRRLLKHLATRIIELDRGKIFDWSCDYETFLARKGAFLDAELNKWDRFDKKLAQEEVWIRRGVKARRTRNEGRVRALKAMRNERKKRRELSGKASMTISNAQRSGDLVLEAKNAGFSYGSTTIIKNFSTTIMRGDRIGIIGPNGCGKSTLINLLLGRLDPQQGSVRTGTNCAVVYFDQLRSVLEPEKTVWENVAPGGGDTVFVNGSPVHVISYLRDFLFTSDRAKCPVRQLSGGERNRLLLARMFTLPANILVLDEPTNDLDTETLELLEEILTDFKGTVLVVSHDREFLNNIVTTTLAFEENGTIKEYIGGYDDWERQKAGQIKPGASKLVSAATTPASNKEENPSRKKLSFKEKQELAALPAAIEKGERERDLLHSRMGDQEWYSKPGFVSKAKERLAAIEKEHDAAYRRWEELEKRPS
jgi:ABC transport system ATP-binding/permease protein